MTQDRLCALGEADLADGEHRVRIVLEVGGSRALWTIAGVTAETKVPLPTTL